MDVAIMYLMIKLIVNKETNLMWTIILILFATVHILYLNINELFDARRSFQHFISTKYCESSLIVVTKEMKKRNIKLGTILQIYI